MYISMYVCIIILKLALQVIAIIALWQLMLHVVGIQAPS